MKCWKCGQAMASEGRCPSCGATQIRCVPATAQGRAMRQLYDHYGCREVLSNPTYLCSGLGDLLDNAQTLRQQLRLAMDGGLGRLYLTQLETVGAPDGDFARRVTALIESAGLSGAVAGQLMGYFDEMIGWSAPPSQQTSQRSTAREASYSPTKGFHMVIEDAFPIEGRGLVVTGMLHGGVRLADSCKIEFKYGGSAITTVIGIERYHQLYDELRAPEGDNTFGVGLLIRAHFAVDKQALVGGTIHSV